MNTAHPKNKIATFAGGCFWCTTSSFDNRDGIKKIVSGYIGGHIEHPTYEQVCYGNSGHYEAVQITFDPEIISYRTLLELFFKQIDPTDDSGSFVDRGTQYRSAVFYHDDMQKKEALRLIKLINESKAFNHPVVTKLLEAPTFYPAEEHHQEYHKKNPTGYKYYRAASGREIFIENYRETFGNIFDEKILVPQ